MLCRWIGKAVRAYKKRSVRVVKLTSDRVSHWRARTLFGRWFRFCFSQSWIYCLRIAEQHARCPIELSNVVNGEMSIRQTAGCCTDFISVETAYYEPRSIGILREMASRIARSVVTACSFIWHYSRTHTNRFETARRRYILCTKAIASSP